MHCLAGAGIPFIASVSGMHVILKHLSSPLAEKRYGCWSIRVSDVGHQLNQIWQVKRPHSQWIFLHQHA